MRFHLIFLLSITACAPAATTTTEADLKAISEVREQEIAAEYTSSDIVVAGDWAFEHFSGNLTTTLKAGGEPIVETLKGIHIYQRQADGSWRIAWDTWNSDNPPPGP